MNSVERHQKRYERRKKKREAAKAKRNEGHTFQEATSFGALRKSFYKARKGTNWKASVQRYGCNVLRNSYVQSQRVRQHKDISRGFIKFSVCERGKQRKISSVHISERVVQKSFCTNILAPVLEPSLMYSNCASQAGKGTKYSSEKLVRDLRRFYRKNGFSNEGYIILGDGHDYFGSLRHDIIIKNMNKAITDKEAVEYISKFVTAYNEDGNTHKGVGLGSETMQINAVAYSDSVDHYLAEKESLPSGKYMDDWNVIVRDKETAIRILDKLKQMYRSLGIEPNEKKTGIVKLSHGFTWLQDRYYLTKTGKVICKPSHKNITHNRQKLKKLAKLYEAGIISFKDVQNFYSSRNGYFKGKNAHRTKREMDALFNDLFIRRFINEPVFIS